METTPLATVDLIPDGSPASIQLAARELVRLIELGSVDADSFAENIGIALAAMGVPVPLAMQAMIATAVRNGINAEPDTLPAA